MGNLMQLRGVKSTVYSALTVAILGAGTGYLVAPYESMTNVFTYAKGPDCIMLWQCVGAALLMLPTWTYNLKVRSLLNDRESSTLQRTECTVLECNGKLAWFVTAA